MEIIKTCRDFPSVQDKYDPRCMDLFETDIILVRKIAKGGFGVVYEIKTIENGERYALKINTLSSFTITELKTDCMLDEIRNLYTDSVIGIKSWFLCHKPPQYWDLFELPLILKGPWETGKTLLYFIMNLAETSLDKLDIPLSEYDITCILFELLYVLLLFQVKLKLTHNDIKSDNILFSIVTYGRKYTIQGIEFYVRSPYLPMLSDFGIAQINENNTEDIANLLTTIIDFTNEKVEITGAFSDQILQIDDLLDEGLISVFRSSLFTSRLNLDHGKLKIIKEFKPLI